MACQQANLFQFFGSSVGASAFLRLPRLTGELFAGGSEDCPGVLGTASTNACTADCLVQRIALSDERNEHFYRVSLRAGQLLERHLDQALSVDAVIGMFGFGP